MPWQSADRPPRASAPALRNFWSAPFASLFSVISLGPFRAHPLLKLQPRRPHHLPEHADILLDQAGEVRGRAAARIVGHGADALAHRGVGEYAGELGLE